MELQLNYKGKDFNKTKELVIKAYDDVSFRFKDKLEKIAVCVHKNRKEFDKKLNRKTKLWEVANVMNGEINIIHTDSFAKESSHKTDEFFPILKHEIAHLFIDKKTELILKLDKNYYYPNFEIIFKSVFGETLKDLEKEFVSAINTN